ncbi:hypothetical protein KUCAC02_032860, partial [Chaenocephalus aceratus]
LASGASATKFKHVISHPIITCTTRRHSMRTSEKSCCRSEGGADPGSAEQEEFSGSLSPGMGKDGQLGHSQHSPSLFLSLRTLQRGCGA